MISRTRRSFRDGFRRLPAEVKQQTRRAYAAWKVDPFHGSLQFKSVSEAGNLWSVRIGRGYRALGRRYGNTVEWFWIGSHAEYDQLI